MAGFPVLSEIARTSPPYLRGVLRSADLRRADTV
jgi:hypothetical protein